MAALSQSSRNLTRQVPNSPVRAYTAPSFNLPSTQRLKGGSGSPENSQRPPIAHIVPIAPPAPVLAPPVVAAPRPTNHKTYVTIAGLSATCVTLISIAGSMLGGAISAEAAATAGMIVIPGGILLTCLARLCVKR